MTLVQRQQLIIYLKSHKHERQIRKYGHIVYSNRKEKWVSMYINQDALESTIAQLERLKFVTNVLVSPYKTLKTDYTNHELNASV
ncbi:YlbG family protein [Macrococcoides caseolyticum]|uniref:YlbG family protein n=1 Tax=Macrococcoides caseolyticum TaxID=69966 RepID=UPI001F3E7F74|nr:YlbG family protein [Macrococcus caseolyticus]MCE4956884.1 YlbG family protein [Macrococcus caseolyticus]